MTSIIKKSSEKDQYASSYISTRSTFTPQGSVASSKDSYNKHKQHINLSTAILPN